MVSSCGNAGLLGQQNLLCHRLTEGLELGVNGSESLFCGNEVFYAIWKV